MKFKTTAKAIRSEAYNPISAGYCDLQYLLSYNSPVAYTCGIYGWNFDVYEVYGVTICTGYRGMVGERAKGIQEYEDKAKKILHSDLDYNRKKVALDKLLHEFCKLNGGY